MGSYEVVVKFPRLMKAILGVVNSAIMPAASQLAALGREGTLQRLVRTGTTFHVVLAYPIVMGLMFFAGSFLQVWIGPEYKDLATLLRVAFAYNLVVALVGTGGSVLVGSDRFLGWNAGIGAASAVLNVGLTLVLMQYFGLLGVFAATTLSLTLALPAYYTLYKRTAGVSFAEVGGIVIRVLLAGIVPAIVMIGFTNIVPPTNVIGLVAALITWVALQWAVLYFMTLDRATRTEIRTVLRLAIPALA
jgi:O-antigen/teichoic acid export membrane protein